MVEMLSGRVVSAVFFGRVVSIELFSSGPPTSRYANVQKFAYQFIFEDKIASRVVHFALT